MTVCQLYKKLDCFRTQIKASYTNIIKVNVKLVAGAKLSLALAFVPVALAFEFAEDQKDIGTPYDWASVTTGMHSLGW